MENNIFENAKFGDKFLTRDGRIGIYAMKSYLDGKLANWVLLKDTSFTWGYDDNGMLLSEIDHDLDIVSRYQEPIDEDKLAELAINFVTKGRNIPFANQIGERVAFKAGYRKAMEDL